MLIADLFPEPFGRPTNGLHLLPRLQWAGRAVLVLLGTTLGQQLQQPKHSAAEAQQVCTWSTLLHLAGFASFPGCLKFSNPSQSTKLDCILPARFWS